MLLSLTALIRRSSFGALRRLTVFTYLVSLLIHQVRAAIPSVAEPIANAPQNAWAKMEKLFILYV